VNLAKQQSDPLLEILVSSSYVNFADKVPTGFQSVTCKIEGGIAKILFADSPSVINKLVCCMALIVSSKHSMKEPTRLRAWS
jgi:hypothetical protein